MGIILHVKNKIDSKIKSLISVKGILYLFFCVCIFISFYSHIGSVFYYSSMLPSSAEPIQLEPNKHYISEFKSNGDPIKEVEIQFCAYQRINHGTLYVSINNGRETLYTWVLPTEEILDNDFHVFKAENKILLDESSVYYLDIYEEYEGDNAIAVYSAPSSGGNIVAGEDIYYNRAFCGLGTFENTFQKNKYLPVYLTGLLLLMLFTACLIDLRNYSIHRGVLIFAAVILFFKMADYDLFRNFAKKTVVENCGESDTTFSVASNQRFVSDISVTRSPFNSLEFFVEGETYGNIAVELKNARTGEIYFDDIILRQDILNDGRTGKDAVIIKSEKSFPKGNYIISVRNDGEDDLSLNILDDGRLNILAEQETYIAHRMAMFVFFLLGFTFIFIAAYAIKKFEFHHLYLTALIPLSVCYLVLFVPWSQPDTGSHFLATYRFSNIVMGYGKEFEWYGRESDAEFYRDTWGKDLNPSLKSYSGIVHNMELICEKPEMVELPAKAEHMEYYSIVNYLPAVLGLSLGRLLNLGTVLSIYLGRVFQMALYIWATYRAVKRTPFGKGVLAGVAALPMCLMMSSAISYDLMVILSTISFTASILFLYKNRNSVAGLAEAAVWSFVIGSVKGGGYLILLPLVFIIANKDTWKDTWRKMALIIVTGLVAVVLFDKVLPAGMGLFQFGVEESEKMTAAYALQEPLHFLDMCIETYLIHLDSLTIDIGGTALAWLEETVPSVIIVLLMIMIGIYSIFEKDDFALGQKDKYILAFIVIVGVIATPAMLLSVVTKGSGWINGLQGRYYLPLLPIVFMIFTKFSLHYMTSNEPTRETVKNKVILAYGFLSFFAVYYMLRLYLRR